MPQPTPFPEPAANGRPLRVLIADDVAESRQQTAALVERLGHRTVLASGGRQALDLAQREAPDLVLLDLLMPDMDGYEVAEHLRRTQVDRWLPVIVTSSLQGEEHFILALSRGADDCLVRPLDPALLEAKLRHYQRVLGLQSRLNALAQRQRSINDHIGDAVFTIDRDGRICEYNRAAARLLRGTDDAKLGGGAFAERLGFDPRQAAGPQEVCVRDHEGRDRTMSASVASWQFEGTTFTTVALHDLTEQRELQRMKDEFLATVSHELRTPLTSIRGALGLLDAGAAGELPAAGRKLVDVALRNGERLGRLIDDVLDLTRLESNSVHLSMRPCRLAELVRESASGIAGFADRAGVRVDVQVLAESAVAQADSDRFLQVMANLLSNAVKHSPPGQAVALSLRGSAQGWRIAVQDRGPGIEPGFKARLFSKFAQADGSDRRAVGGTGLGLYISRMLVERMGGRIEVESSAGAGSTFVVTLPAAGPRWLLCVARDRQRAERFIDWLQPLAGVQTASDPAQAMALVERSGPPEAVVADPLGQGDIDAFCRALRATAPLVVLAGDALDDALAQAQQVRIVRLDRDDARSRLLALLAGRIGPSSRES